MKEVYFAAYRREGGDWVTVHAPGLYAPDALPRLPAGAWIGCGNGFAIHAQALAGGLAAQVQSVADVAVPHAREIAALAAASFAKTGGRPAAEALPLYIRDKVALTVEEQRGERMQVRQ
jgi:tRNA threonylcarbamoyladenosine biosynthesis protein TsaB